MIIGNNNCVGDRKRGYCNNYVIRNLSPKDENTKLQIKEDKVLECPICFTEYTPNRPIYQCIKGHILCDTCKSHPSMITCPFCKIDMRNVTIRNRALERIVDSPTDPYSVGEI